MVYNEQQFGELFTAHYESLLGQAHAMLGDKEEARDAISDVFARLWHQNVAGTLLIPLDDGAERFLRLAVKRACIDVLRKRKYRRAWREKLTPDDLFADEPATREEQMAQVEQLMQTHLTEQDRRVLSLVYDEEQTYREAAQHLGISTSAVNKHVTQSLRKLRRLAIMLALLAGVATAAVITIRHASRNTSENTAPSPQETPLIKAVSADDEQPADSDSVATTVTVPVEKPAVPTLRERLATMPESVTVVANKHADEPITRLQLDDLLRRYNIVSVDTLPDKGLSLNTIHKNVLRITTHRRSEETRHLNLLSWYPRLVSVEGTVSGGPIFNGKPLNNATINVSYHNDKWQAATDGYGRFSLTIPRGARVTFSHPGSQSYSFRAKKDKSRLDIRLKDQAHLSMVMPDLRLLSRADIIYINGRQASPEEVKALPWQDIKTADFSSFMTAHENYHDHFWAIIGKVVDENTGKPVAGVAVSTSAWHSNDHSYWVFTDLEGQFAIRTTGSGHIYTEAKGYAPSCTDITEHNEYIIKIHQQ
ncbi:MAG: sigma-70 family RNA polymerase sigma factor [Prevotella sp.]|nr:sigma-70 family RNA polymerase sigma factor [Prevotella sp.]